MGARERAGGEGPVSDLSKGALALLSELMAHHTENTWQSMENVIVF